MFHREIKKFMKKRIKIYSVFVFIAVLFSCKNENKQERKANELLKKEHALQDSIMNGLRLTNNKNFEIYPADTIIELPNETDLILWKNSFITNTGDIYKGKVNITFSFSEDPNNILFNENLPINLPDSLAELKGILMLTVKDNNGNALNFNPKYATGLRFLPPTKMLGGLAYLYDSVSKNYYSPIKVYEVYRDFKSEESSPVLINLDLADLDSINTADRKVKYKGKKLTNKEVIGYELTLKYPGFYYTGRKAREENLQEASVNISLKSAEALNFEKTKVLLFSQNEDYNYYLRTKYIGSGKYKVIPAPGYGTVKLPLNYKYTIFAYHIEGEKCYFSIKRDVILSSTFDVDLTLTEENVDKLIKIINSL